MLIVVGRSSSCQPKHTAEQLSTDDVVTRCPFLWACVFAALCEHHLLTDALCCVLSCPVFVLPCLLQTLTLATLLLMPRVG